VVSERKGRSAHARLDRLVRHKEKASHLEGRYLKAIPFPPPIHIGKKKGEGSFTCNMGRGGNP